MSVIQKIKINLTVNKPAYVCICISELSKLRMCESLYDPAFSKYCNDSNELAVHKMLDDIDEVVIE